MTERRYHVTTPDGDAHADVTIEQVKSAIWQMDKDLRAMCDRWDKRASKCEQRHDFVDEEVSRERQLQQARTLRVVAAELRRMLDGEEPIARQPDEEQ